MCGIFGVTNYKLLKQAADNNSSPENIVFKLFNLSETRGHDASGIAVLNSSDILVYKQALPAHKLLQDKTFKRIISNISDNDSLIGHARMETNGSYANPNNNQPVATHGCVTIHNGIIVNDALLWEKFPQLNKGTQVDTEIINALLNFFRTKEDLTLEQAYTKTLGELEGSYSIATFFENSKYLGLATNTGSLYLLLNKSREVVLFASEYYFVETVRETLFNKSDEFTIEQLKPGSLKLIETAQTPTHKINILNNSTSSNFTNTEVNNTSSLIAELQNLVSKEYEANFERVSKLRRCTKCILPETMPFIEFDENGVCNYCRSYKKVSLKGFEELRAETKKYTRSDSKPNCIVAFSGGRDSSYGLHFIKKELNLNPVAYSYDWGMLTDLGRRNQARMIGKLGVEHILISADIQLKRNNIRKNVEAWLASPDLGTVPLFMAGDKQYFYYANMLKKQMGIDLVILCENILEKTDFKSGFCNIPPKVLSQTDDKFYKIGFKNTLGMFFYYAKKVIQNPKYINTSIFDTLWGFASYYVIPHEYLSLYKYIKWEETTVEQTLKDYNWELANDTVTTWRIGDGTAAFYNYIYYTMAGFSENDTFRSNQIREGDITRDEALRLSIRDNKPRVESLVWYGQTINLDIKKAIEKINQAPKRY